MKITPVRTTLVLVALALTLVVAFSGLGAAIYRRTSIAASLIGTFFLYPLSLNHHTVTVTAQDTQAINNTDTKDESLISSSHSSSSIPKHIHQVKLGSLDMRPTWTEARQSCMTLHPTWEFTLWEDKQADAFVKQYYPQLFDMYRAYPLEIQRSNVLRYLLLDQFGGVYLDLDLGCRVALDDVLASSMLRDEHFITPPANPTGVNNAFIASVAHHPFWTHLIQNLPTYNLPWFSSPYITNMMSTGCHFFSTMHRTFNNPTETLAVLDQANKLNGHVTTPLFVHLGASSWHKGDAKAILRLGQAVEQMKRHGAIFTFASLAVVASILVLVVVLLRRRSTSRQAGYMDVEASKDMVEHHNDQEG